MEEVIELGRHKPSVNSVISRLNRYEDRIKSITVLITWDDGSIDISHDSKSNKDLVFEEFIFKNYLNTL